MIEWFNEATELIAAGAWLLVAVSWLPKAINKHDQRFSRPYNWLIVISGVYFTFAYIYRHYAVPSQTMVLIFGIGNRQLLPTALLLLGSDGAAHIIEKCRKILLRFSLR